MVSGRETVVIVNKDNNVFYQKEELEVREKTSKTVGAFYEQNGVVILQTSSSPLETKQLFGMFSFITNQIIL